jgi:hypothetical protein
MGTLTNLNSTAQPLPPEVTMDSELAAAINAHLGSPDPHIQYLMERLFPVLSLGTIGKLVLVGGYGETPFNANLWNPNSGQPHVSAINIAAIGVNSGNTNLPLGVYEGVIAEIEPYCAPQDASSANKYKLQVFSYQVNSLLFFRRQVDGTWRPWQQFSFLDQAQNFVAQQNFRNGIEIGAGGTVLPLKRLIARTFTIDPPTIAGQGVTVISLNVSGAVLGDSVFVNPIDPDLWVTAQWPFEFPACVAGEGIVHLYLRNDWGGELNLAPFQVRVIVMGF